MCHCSPNIKTPFCGKPNCTLVAMQHHTELPTLSDPVLIETRPGKDTSIFRLPTFEDCWRAKRDRTNNVLHDFIHDNEPNDDEGEKEFRQMLFAVIIAAKSGEI